MKKFAKDLPPPPPNKIIRDCVFKISELAVRSVKTNHSSVQKKRKFIVYNSLSLYLHKIAIDWLLFLKQPFLLKVKLIVSKLKSIKQTTFTTMTYNYFQVSTISQT